MDVWQELLIAPAKTMLTQIGQFVVSALLVIILFIIGWLISKFVIRLGIIKGLKFLKLDELAKRIELDTLLSKGGITLSLSELIGAICYWLALLITFVVALNSVGLTIAADLLQRITLFIPNIIVAIFILIMGMFASVILKNIVKTAATNAGISQVNLLSKLTEVVIMIFAVIMALEQLQINVKIVELAITIILAAFGLGFALAFGLGCKDLVGKAVSDFLNKVKTKKGAE